MKVTTDNLNISKKVIELLIQISKDELSGDGQHTLEHKLIVKNELNALYSVQTILENSDDYLIDEDNS
tara:strand:+ start:285 stop:488 length:204 start_codon:yes stop_codon:yes gene_type:complete